MHEIGIILPKFPSPAERVSKNLRLEILNSDIIPTIEQFTALRQLAHISLTIERIRHEFSSPPRFSARGYVPFAEGLSTPAMNFWVSDRNPSSTMFNSKEALGLLGGIAHHLYSSQLSDNGIKQIANRVIEFSKSIIG